MSTDGVLGAAYLPTDGYIDPSQLTFALVEGARRRGAEINEETRVTAIDVDGGAVGAVVTPIVGAAFILTVTQYSSAQLYAMSPEQLQSYQIAEANTVKAPYLVISGMFLALAALIYFAHLPESPGTFCADCIWPVC